MSKFKRRQNKLERTKRTAMFQGAIGNKKGRKLFMRTVKEVKSELEKTNSSITRLKDLNLAQAKEMSSLEASRLKLENELTTAPDKSESAAAVYINSHYKRPDENQSGK